MRVLHNNSTPLPIFFLSFCYMWWRVFWHLRKQRVFFLCPVDICTFGLCMQCFTELKTHVRPPYFLFGSWSEFSFLYPQSHSGKGHPILEYSTDGTATNRHSHAAFVRSMLGGTTAAVSASDIIGLPVAVVLWGVGWGRIRPKYKTKCTLLMCIGFAKAPPFPKEDESFFLEIFFGGGKSLFFFFHV